MDSGNTAQFMQELMSLPRDVAHGRLYYAVTGRKLDLDNPRDLNEKLQWLMVNRYDRNVSLFADKLAVRDYVRSCGFESILTRIYAVYDRPEDIDVAGLPERFVLKCNHGSGPKFYALCRDRKSFDAAEAKMMLGRALECDFSRVGLEYHYAYIKPYIYAEEFLDEELEDDAPVTDYKFFCFGGHARYVKVISGRGNGVHQDYYDADWNFCPFVKDEVTMHGGMPRPDNFAQMLEIASGLSTPFPMARVDLYNIRGKIYFGEITLTPATGLNRTDKPSTLELFGNLTDLDYWKPELFDFARTDEIERLIRADEAEERQNAGADRMPVSQDIVESLRNSARRIFDDPGILNRISKADADSIMSDCCRIMAGNYDNGLKSLYMGILFRLAFREDMSLEECWQIYWNLNRVMFVNYNLRIHGGSLDELYRYIFDFVKSQIDFSDKPFRAKAGRVADRAVVITSQFLRIGHAPTRRVLDYSYVLQHDLGYKVVIINDGGMHYYENPALDGVITFNFLEAFNGSDHIDYRGERFEFLQTAERMPRLDVLQQLVNIIYDINPMFVYNIGASCLTSDLCNDFVTVCSLPCSLSLPVTTCSYPVLGRELEVRHHGKNGIVGRDDLDPGFDAGEQDDAYGWESDIERMKRLLPYQKVIETNYNYTFKAAPETYSREQFGIPAGAFMAAVTGHRLSDEAGSEFLDAVGEALERVPNLYVVFIGGATEGSLLERWAKSGAAGRERAILTGSLEGASSLVALADLTLNPDRSGGGRAAFEGCCFGIPEVSLRRGDAYYTMGRDFGADDYSEYTALIVRYATDSDFRDMMHAKALQRAEILKSMTETQRRVIERILGEDM